MAQRPHAVVIGLDSITGLQTARILAQRGVPVIALAGDPAHYCCRTRVCERIIPTDISGEGLIQALERLGPELEQPAVLFPCADMGVASISLHRERLAPWFRVMLPPHSVVELLMDKVRFTSFAQEHGLPIPRTFRLRDRADAEEAAAALAYPVVLKPPLRTLRWDARFTEKAFKPGDPQELLEVYDRTASSSDELLVQEWVPGPAANLYSCNGYFGSDSSPLATFVARKLRQWPPETGISSLGEECRNDAVLESTLKLFALARFRGLGYLEVKQHERTGEHLIIEPNVGRPTGRSAIAEAGGVELLHTMYCDAVGLPLPVNRRQRYTGAKWIYYRSDLQSALHDWREGKLGVRDWWRSVRGPKVDAVLSWRDPGPFLSELLRGVRLLAAGRELRPRQAAAGARPATASPERMARTKPASNGARPAAHTRRARSAAAEFSFEPLDGVQALGDEWNSLATAGRNVFATSEWLATWLRHAPPGEPVVTACRDQSGRLVAVLPLYLESARGMRILRFIGHGPGDQLGPICAVADQPTAARALDLFLDECRRRWHVFVGQQLPGERWHDTLGARQLRREANPVLRFPAERWDDFLDSLTTGLRKEIRYDTRRLARKHAVEYRLADDPSRLQADLDVLFGLHAAQWHERSAFSGEWEGFHREFAATALARDWLRFWLLEADGRVIAAKYNFRFAGVEFSYQAGRDVSWKRGSLGLVILAHAMRQAFEEGVREYRFLRGGEKYKFRFPVEDAGMETIVRARGPVGRAALSAGTALANVPSVAVAGRRVTEWSHKGDPAS